VRRTTLALAAALAVAGAGSASAKFAPTFELTVSPTKVGANPTLTTKLRFASDDDEIGLYTLQVPAGYSIASDGQVPDVPARPGRPQGDLLGTGSVTIDAGPGCNPAFPVRSAHGAVTIGAKIYERPVTSEEKGGGAVAAWVLDIEPLNRVRLLVKGSTTKGWTVAGSPTPSDNTCNPLAVDLTISGVSEAGVKLLTNPSTAGPRTFRATIKDQEGKSSVTYSKVVTTTR
jgi:hypothetical protein